MFSAYACVWGFIYGASVVLTNGVELFAYATHIEYKLHLLKRFLTKSEISYQNKSLLYFYHILAIQSKLKVKFSSIEKTKI